MEPNGVVYRVYSEQHDANCKWNESDNYSCWTACALVPFSYVAMVWVSCKLYLGHGYWLCLWPPNFFVPQLLHFFPCHGPLMHISKSTSHIFSCETPSTLRDSHPSFKSPSGLFLPCIEVPVPGQISGPPEPPRCGWEEAGRHYQMSLCPFLRGIYTSPQLLLWSWDWEALGFASLLYSGGFSGPEAQN